MKILHTADWHLGKRLYDVSRLPEQIEVLQEICEIVEKEEVDVVLIAGDLFDTFNPPVDATELFYKTLKRLSGNGKRWVVAIAGNHDSPDRIVAPDPLAIECGIILVPYPITHVNPIKLDSGLEILYSDKGVVELGLPNSGEVLRLLLTPYANEFRMKTSLLDGDEEDGLRDLLEKHWKAVLEERKDVKATNILMAHLFVAKNAIELPDEPDDEKPILHVGGAQAIYSSNFPQGLDYVALGHLHRKHAVVKEPYAVVYSGSPLSYSFSEANQQKYVMLLDTDENNDLSYEPLELNSGKKLLRFRAESIEEGIDWLRANQGTWVEITVVKDEYLTTADKKQLHDAHDGILGIIPEIKNANLLENGQSNIDLTKSINELFEDYFLQKTGQEVNDEVKAMFKEILAEN